FAAEDLAGVLAVHHLHGQGQALLPVLLPDADQYAGPVRVGGFRLGVTGRDVLGVNVLPVQGPDQGEDHLGPPEARGVDGVGGRVGQRLGGVALEPGAVEALRVGLGGAGEVPAVVP